MRSPMAALPTQLMLRWQNPMQSPCLTAEGYLSANLSVVRFRVPVEKGAHRNQ